MDLRGPFTVEIVQTTSLDSHMFYILKVQGTDGNHTVRRRYTCFAEMSKALDPYGDVLPQMPPKSFFRKQFSSGFRDERARVLGGLLVAAMEADPFATHPPLRSFLGISKLEDEEEPQSLPRILTGIPEAENESYSSSYKSNPAHPCSNRSSYATREAPRFFDEVIHDDVLSTRTARTRAGLEQTSSGRAATRSGSVVPSQNAEVSTGRSAAVFGPVVPEEEMPVFFELIS